MKNCATKVLKLKLLLCNFKVETFQFSALNPSLSRLKYFYEISCFKVLTISNDL